MTDLSVQSFVQKRSLMFEVKHLSTASEDAVEQWFAGAPLKKGCSNLLNCIFWSWRATYSLFGHKHPSFTNLTCHLTMDFLSGTSSRNFVRNARWTHVHNSVFANWRTQNALSCLENAITEPEKLWKKSLVWPKTWDFNLSNGTNFIFQLLIVFELFQIVMFPRLLKHPVLWT